MTRAWPVWASVAAFTAVAIVGILLRPLMPIDETRYVEVAWEMHLSGDWFIPTKNGDLYTHKPPLLFWLINLIWAVTGVSEFAARLVGPFFGAVTILLSARLSREIWPDEERTARRAAMVLTGISLFSLYGGATMFDTLLATSTLIGLIGLFRALTRGGYGWWALYGGGLALGVYAKGPVIFFHLLPALVLYPLWLAREDRPPVRSVLAGFGLAFVVALALVGLWLAPALIMGGSEYREAVLWRQSVGRMANSFAHAREWWFYPAMLPALLFPWFWMPAVWRGALRAKLDEGTRFTLAWMLGSGLLFGLISAKQLHYLLPVMPAAALFIARVLPDDPGRPRFNPAVVPALLVVAGVVAANLGVGGREDAQMFLSPDWAVWLWGGLVVALCAVVARLPVLTGGVALGLGMILLANVLIATTDPRKTYDTHEIGAIMAAHEPDGVAINQSFYHAEFNFSGRLTRPVALVPDREAVVEWARAHPKGVIVGQPRHSTIPWEPRETTIFRNKTYGIWYVEDAPAEALAGAADSG
ncbi:ArnT family glycosyltransferase [Jhaorihella thermophila]|uniref:4-amino-4-deoxy-L-arabinose transferase n=1 Tax=Jhaorihella thermophila TaxID=488547 RepID=A0A1H5U5X7_9RHOB|nr:glycosyltransferase family 39 protein [Jhaorihella thermophila]SEF69858.1 4-amino-4-deoxy-L-arabinose transferase [Jhaorihella thermophila]